MSSSTEKSSTSRSAVLTSSNIILAGISWGVAALLFFLLFSASPPDWYSPVTYIFECVAYLAAALLCLRNWQSTQIVSGRNVWLGIGLGMLSYFIGDVLFGIWELVWEQDPAVSPGDLFFLITYICLSWGMILAVTSRRLNLEVRQWLIIAAIGLVASALAFWLSLPVEVSQTAAVEQTTPQPIEAVADAAAETETSAPAWVVQLEERLEPLETPVTLLYTILDVALLIAASTLLLAFWGGRTSQSWRMIAAAAFSLYIADMSFKYALTRLEDYQSGGLLEVFWVFSPVLFAIGAALEYDLSTRTSRRSRRRA